MANRLCQNIAPNNQPPHLPVTRRHLVTIESKQENDFIVSLLRGRAAWIGGFRFPDGTYGWTDGHKWYGNYNNFRSGQPDNHDGEEDSILMNGYGQGQWIDIPFNHRHGFVCQYLDLEKVAAKICIPQRY